MKKFVFLSLVVWASCALSGRSAEPAKAAKPLVEVVFCLDTTGSMGGLIDAAKQKIWAISNQIAGGNPTPRLKIGLVAYRDRGDEYVTKLVDLTEDLDAIHGQLMGLRAGGGGDTPESVNQALNEAVTKMTWSKEPKTLKIVFLVGDAPPKIYANDVPYKESCLQAVKNNIIVNTIQCGNMAETTAEWKSICRLAEGSFVQIDQQGGPIVTVATPYDGELQTINRDLAASTLTYGNRFRQAEGKAKADAAAALAPAAAAERAGFSGKSGATAAYDLLDSVKKGEVDLNKLSKEELPDELKNLNGEEKQTYLRKVDEKRQVLLQRAQELDKKRGEFITKKLAEDTKTRPQDSFDGQVLQILQRQAGRAEIRYGIDEKKK